MSYPPSLFKTTIMKIILLDDERNMSDIKWINYPQHDEVIVIRTYLDFTNFVASLSSLEGLLFTFDHDIQDYKNLSTHDLIPTCYGMVELGRNDSKFEFDGLRCMYYLTTQVNNFNTDTVYIHSKNGIGAANMMAYVSQFD